MCYCPTPTLHLNLALTGDCAFLLSPPKNSLCMIYKRFEKWGNGQCPEKFPSPCNTSVIPVSLYKFMSSFVTKTSAHTHTHTESRSSTCTGLFILKFCHSKPVRPLFIFGTQIKIFLIKSESFLTLHRQQCN